MQYLPDIMKEIVTAVSNVMEAQTDSFEVFFEYGLYQDVSKSVYKKNDTGQGTYPLVWLVMPFDEVPGKIQAHTDVSCRIIIGMPTQLEWTMTQREDNNFFPRLIPIYDELLKQITRNKKLNSTQLEPLQKRRILPYWGGDETGNNTANFSTHYIDAIDINELKLSVRNKIC